MSGGELILDCLKPHPPDIGCHRATSFLTPSVPPATQAVQNFTKGCVNRLFVGLSRHVLRVERLGELFANARRREERENDK